LSKFSLSEKKGVVKFYKAKFNDISPISYFFKNLEFKNYLIRTPSIFEKCQAVTFFISIYDSE